MLKVLAQSWPLLLGVMLLMVGNGVQGSLLGIRGALEGFSTFELSVVMSAYFLGFLGGSRLAPEMIRPPAARVALIWEAAASVTSPHSACIRWVVTSSTLTGRKVPAPTCSVTWVNATPRAASSASSA